jgi:hypothetical protein
VFNAVPRGDRVVGGGAGDQFAAFGGGGGVLQQVAAQLGEQGGRGVVGEAAAVAFDAGGRVEAHREEAAREAEGVAGGFDERERGGGAGGVGPAKEPDEAKEAGDLGDLARVGAFAGGERGQVAVGEGLGEGAVVAGEGLRAQVEQGGQVAGQGFEGLRGGRRARLRDRRVRCAARRRAVGASRAMGWGSRVASARRASRATWRRQALAEGIESATGSPGRRLIVSRGSRSGRSSPGLRSGAAVSGR